MSMKALDIANIHRIGPTGVVGMMQPVTMTRAKGKNKLLVERLSAILRERSTNPRAVSRAAGLADTYIYDVLNGRNLKPSVQAIQAIAKVLDTTLAHLLGEDDHALVSRVDMISDAIPLIAIAEHGAFRMLGNNADFPPVFGPRSRHHGGAAHFAVQIGDDGMSARTDGPALTAGMTALCIEMTSAGLIVESGHLYCIRNSRDDGKTWETLIRRARVFRDRTVLVAESTTSYDEIVGSAAIPVLAAAATPPVHCHLCAIGLLYAAVLSI